MKFQPSNVHPEIDEAGNLKAGYLSLKAIPEADLWELFKHERIESRNTQVFDYIYLKYFPVLFRYGHKFSKDGELVKDIIQDLFVYLKTKGKGLGTTTSIKFYLYKAYRRRISRHLKRTRFRFPEKDISHEAFGIALSQESRMIDAAMDDEMNRKLESAIERLTLRQKKIISYYFFENFSYREITSVMGFSNVQYARISLCRSIAKLRRVLSDQQTIRVSRGTASKSCN